MANPLYLTDAERPLRPVVVQDAYRFFVVFRLRSSQYTRWFQTSEDRQSYLDSAGAEVMNLGEGPTSAQTHAHQNILKEINRRCLPPPHRGK